MRLGKLVFLCDWVEDRVVVSRFAFPSNSTKTAPHETGPDVRCLAMSYFHMGKPHTIIGDEPFHGRVRKGIGWFQFSMVTRRKKIWMIHKRSIKRKV